MKKSPSSKRYGSKKTNDFNINKYTYYGCDEQSHIKAECPNSEVKEKQISKMRKGEKGES